MTIKEIKFEYEHGLCDYITTIERLQDCGYEPFEAEELVESWEEC